jgi:hypothetical protein
MAAGNPRNATSSGVDKAAVTVINTLVADPASESIPHPASSGWPTGKCNTD